MRSLWRERGLSIFGRTFLLMFAALLVAEGIGLALLINRPPMHNAPVSLAQVARTLRPTDALRQEQGPPPQRDDRGRPGDFGPPPGPPPGQQAHDQGGAPPEGELSVRESATPPDAPRDADRAASATLQTRLARLLDADPASVRIYVGAGDVRSSRPGQDSADGTMLREGFVAAYRQADGRWRSVE
ncbi:MAG: hypothetical protein ACREO0_11510, partial [Pseudoxanthomonas sp.]